ncbi:MAG: glycosyltransferase family 1 protein [Porticoccus sp.]|nr:glycosyltransferase family 1 protein [Porticoccus sp.]
MTAQPEKKLCLGVVGPLPPPAGGMATQTSQLVKLFKEEGLEVCLVQTNRPYRPKSVEKLRGVRALFRLVPYLVAVWKMAGKVDVIHLMANSGWSWQLFSTPVVWLAWLKNTPVIVNYRGGEAGSYFKQSFRWIRPTLNRATKIVVPSGYLQEVFAKFGVETTVIPNIINLERFRPAAIVDDAPATKGFRVIITRNLEAIYGIATAINALAIVRREIPAIELAIAGSGPQLAELTALTDQLGLQEHVQFVGRLDAQQIVDFYQSADLVLNPTTVDNMPNSVLEALACGVPVVTTDVGGIPYIVSQEKTALMVPAGDAAAMAAQIIRLYREEETRQRLIDNGLDAVRLYAWPVVKEQWLTLYRSLRSGL